MTVLAEDPIWPEFKLLWPQPREAGGSLVLGGGYGLILKQHWLGTNPATATIVPIANWREPPRVTKDLDIVLGLDLISSHKAQEHISEVLVDCGYSVNERNPRWQFEKTLPDSRELLVDFHACVPEGAKERLRTDKIRVKHAPSLGEIGVHGRRNPEADGSELHPFEFQLDGIVIAVPNPVTWCNMKLTAMRDRWLRAEDESREPKHREFHRQQAIKHAQDVCRAVAMTTRNEGDHAAEVVTRIQATTTFIETVRIHDEFFGDDGLWGTRVTRNMWTEEDGKRIRDVLGSWFR